MWPQRRRTPFLSVGILPAQQSAHLLLLSSCLRTSGRRGRSRSTSTSTSTSTSSTSHFGVSCLFAPSLGCQLAARRWLGGRGGGGGGRGCWSGSSSGGRSRSRSEGGSRRGCRGSEGSRSGRTPTPTCLAACTASVATGSSPTIVARHAPRWSSRGLGNGARRLRCVLRVRHVGLCRWGRSIGCRHRRQGRRRQRSSW